jgi:hypothetical protein
MAETPTHLILVCCHAIYLGGPTSGTSESEWLIAPFQTGETPTFTSHIITALKLFSSSPSSLLVFSGSNTRPETRKSEAQSYFDLCFDNDFWGLDEWGFLRERIVLEEQALDSFGNLVFSVILFWRKTGKWPEMITIASHAFKEARFMELHVPAMRWPRERVRFVGVDPGYMVEGSLDFDAMRSEDVRRGEMERGFKEWERDPTGRGEKLRGKRKGRNPWRFEQFLFPNDEERERSGVKSEILREDGMVEEVLLEQTHPWEVGG